MRDTILILLLLIIALLMCLVGWLFWRTTSAEQQLEALRNANDVITIERVRHNMAMGDSLDKVNAQLVEKDTLLARIERKRAAELADRPTAEEDRRNHVAHFDTAGYLNAIDSLFARPIAR